MFRIIRLALLVITLTSTLVLLWPRPGIVQARRLAACQNSLTVSTTANSGAGSLRQALTDVCSGGTINFAAGLANQIITLTTAELSITKTVTITNPDAANLKVSGNNARRVFNIQAGAVVTISSLSVISGTASGDGGGGIYNAGTLVLRNSILRNHLAYEGGAVQNYFGTITIFNSTFSNNSASFRGGGISSYYGVVTITNSIFSNNSAFRDGGGISNNYGPMVVTNTTISGNSATNPGSQGGGINNGDGILNIADSTFSDNVANWGGGIYNIGGSAIMTVTYSNLISNSAHDYGGGIGQVFGSLMVMNSNLNNNSARNGGGVHNVGSGKLTVINSTFNGNTVSGRGGGIHNGDSGIAMISTSTLSGNSTSDSGGGIYNWSVVAINNSTISGNSAREGGGVYNSSGILTVDNVTFSGNLASFAGVGITNNYGAILNLRNTILANSFGDNRDCYIYGTITTNLNNLIENGNCNPALSGDPLLGPLADNGGLTLTHALLPGSPAIDAGDSATCLSTDQRGVSRPVDGNGDNFAVCDIGAYEAPGPATPTVQFTQAVYTTTENIGTSQNVILTRTGSLTNSSQVQVSLGGGTASAGSDYSSAGFPQTITFGSGVISQTVPITITDDVVVEPTESISLTLTPLVNAVIGSQSSAVLQIQDNDAAQSPESKVYLPVVLK